MSSTSYVKLGRCIMFCRMEPKEEIVSNKCRQGIRNCYPRCIAAWKKRSLNYNQWHAACSFWMTRMVQVRIANSFHPHLLPCTHMHTYIPTCGIPTDSLLMSFKKKLPQKAQDLVLCLCWKYTTSKAICYTSESHCPAIMLWTRYSIQKQDHSEMRWCAVYVKEYLY